MELTITPLIVLIGAPASQNWSPGVWEMIIILVIALILVGAYRLPDIARGLGESIRNFKSAIAPEPRRQSSDSRSWVSVVLALTAGVIILSILRLDGLSGEQKLVLSVTLLVWIAVGYWSFGRNLRKRDGR
jgi:sec-independent protein translocase protein TatA